MRRYFSLAVVAVLLSSLPAFADLKVGYVDLQRALGEVHEGVAAKTKLKADLEKKKTDFEAEQNKLRSDKEVLDKQGPMMSEEVRTQKFTELQKRLFELTQKAEKLQMEMATAEQKELKKIFEKMDPIIASFAQRDGLTMMFEKTDSGLVYAPASLDYTNELVRTYNDKYPKTGGGAPAKTDKAPAPKGEAPKKDGPAAAK
ncbi:MAG: OmpH family outer membrane protein [Myxococcaceae bacterium]|nr:OmpH family outer membrane protein [Myxococcaceae bacterium]